MEQPFKRLLDAEFAAFHKLTEGQLDLLESHYTLLKKWNSKMNLWRVTDLREAVELHYCESLYLGHQLPTGPLRIADVGSGAGFPGIPVAVLRPDCQVDLIESDQRKAAFLREACGDLPNVKVVALRAEECVPRYDWVVSRAVRSEVLRDLRLAPNSAVLSGKHGPNKVPWGRARFITTFHVEL